MIWFHFLCTILLDLLSVAIELWSQKSYQIILYLDYLCCLPSLQLYLLMNKPNLLNLLVIASIAPNMAVSCSQEVCLHFLILFGSAYFIILTLIRNMVKIEQRNWKLTNGRTKWVTLSILELLFAAKDEKSNQEYTYDQSIRIETI